MTLKEFIESTGENIIRFFSESPLFKGIFVFVGMTLQWFFGQPDIAFYSFLTAFSLDFVTGVWKALKQKNLHSAIARTKVAQKVASYTIVLICAELLSKVGLRDIRNVIILISTGTEIKSIFENLEEIGYKIPVYLKDPILNAIKTVFSKYNPSKGGKE